MRPVELAREHGLSTQAVRNYEADGILPAAQRTQHGYRLYTPRHAQALRTFLALVPAHGHAPATEIMRAVNTDRLDTALTLIDQSHLQLLQDRKTLEAVDNALHDLASDELPHPVRKATYIGELARQLGVRPATLRKWEQAGLVVPERDRLTGYRVYSPTAVRDAHVVHQLRRGGYLLAQIAPLVTHIRNAGGVAPLEATLAQWRDRLTTRARAMLHAAAELNHYLEGAMR